MVTTTKGGITMAEQMLKKRHISGEVDEADEVLETNAEDFVRSYVQKGGE